MLLNTFDIGCDPEFAALNGQGKIINLRAYLPNQVNGNPAPVGIDHNGNVGEFRPGIARSSYVLLKRLQKLILSQPLQEVPGLAKLRAGAYFYGNVIGRRNVGDDIPGNWNLYLGGHLHFGLSPVFTQVGSLYANLLPKVDALDALTRQLEGLDLLPREESVKRRGSFLYGQFGSVRDKGHLEYRTMASWLGSPEITMLALTGGKLAAAKPEVALRLLGGAPAWTALRAFYEAFRNDLNAARVTEKVLPKGLRELQIDHGTDFRERWREMTV